MEPIEWALMAGKIKGFFKGILTSKWTYVVLLMVAIGGGIYFTANHWMNKAVSTAVAGADNKATDASQKAGLEVGTRNQAVDAKANKLKLQTAKDYTNARATLQAAPPATRDAQAPALLIDTINDLDRLRSARDADSVSNSDVPVG